MSKEVFIELCVKFISGEAEVEEQKLLDKMLILEEYKEIFTAIKNKMEDEYEDKEIPIFDSVSGYEKLTKKIRTIEPEYSEKGFNSNSSFFFQPMFYRVAASISFLILLSSVILYFSGVFNKEILLNEKVTEMGQKTILTLFDGTKITLNGGSKLIYPSNFGETTRDVYLEGQGYFEVMHNDQKLFIVHTGEVSTRVLGTKFDVKAFPGEDEISVSLVDGKVSVLRGDETSFLSPGEQLAYNKRSGNESISSFDYLQVIGWKDNVMIFNNKEIIKVFTELERTFGVKFELENVEFASMKIKANFKNDSFWTIVKVLQKTTGLAYRTDSSKGELEKIIFYKK